MNIKIRSFSHPILHSIHIQPLSLTHSTVQRWMSPVEEENIVAKRRNTNGQLVGGNGVPCAICGAVWRWPRPLSISVIKGPGSDPGQERKKEFFEIIRLDMGQSTEDGGSAKETEEAMDSVLELGSEPGLGTNHPVKIYESRLKGPYYARMRQRGVHTRHWRCAPGQWTLDPRFWHRVVKFWRHHPHRRTPVRRGSANGTVDKAPTRPLRYTFPPQHSSGRLKINSRKSFKYLNN